MVPGATEGHRVKAHCLPDMGTSGATLLRRDRPVMVATGEVRAPVVGREALTMTKPENTPSHRQPRDEPPARILLVEDDPGMRDLVARMLQPLGYALVTAASGTEALVRLREQQMDILLLDLMRPELDGFAVCRLLQQEAALPPPYIIIAQVRDEQWSLPQHPGIGSPLGSTAYAMVQERVTYYHYQALRERLRADYGLPSSPTAGEQQRGTEIGAAEACRLVARDELAHHVLFLHLVRSHLKYFPSRTFAELQKVLAGFTMPALRFLPNRRAFLRAVRRTALYSRAIYQEKVYAPVLRALGLA